jgi:hypothetical protein
MKSATAAMDTHLGSTGATLSTCLLLTATDGTQLGFTNYTKPIPFLGVTYQATTGSTPTALESNATLAVDNLDVETIRAIDALTGPDILNGKWDFADMRLFLLNPNDLPALELKLRRGTVGKISLTRSKITSEVRGMMEHLNKQLLELYSPGCRTDLGNAARCQVDLDPPTWTATTAYTLRAPFDAAIGATVKPTTENGRHFKATVAGISGASEPSWNTTIGGTTVDGTVTWTTIEGNTQTGTVTAVSTATKRVFQDSTKTTATADFFTGGLLTFTSGLNIGRSMEIKKFDNVTGQFDLVLPVAFEIAVSDAYAATAGCFKRIEDCRDKFANTHNFQGEPYVQQNFQISPARIDTNAGGK